MKEIVVSKQELWKTPALLGLIFPAAIFALAVLMNYFAAILALFACALFGYFGLPILNIYNEQIRTMTVLKASQEALDKLGVEVKKK